MIADYNKKSLMLGIPGILLQIGGNIFAQGAQEPTMKALGGLVTLVGTGLLIAGLAFYAKAKGRHPAWCLMGFLSCIGLIVLALLKDKTTGA